MEEDYSQSVLKPIVDQIVYTGGKIKGGCCKSPALPKAHPLSLSGPNLPKANTALIFGMISKECPNNPQ